MHPKNHTRFRSLDRIAADPRVDPERGIWDEGKDGIWIKLADGYENELENSTVLHERSCRDLIEAWRDWSSQHPVKGGE